MLVNGIDGACARRTIGDVDKRPAVLPGQLRRTL